MDLKHPEKRRRNRLCLFVFMLALIPLLFAGCGSSRPVETEASEVSASTESGSSEVSASAETGSSEGSGFPEETDRMIYAHVNGYVLKILAAGNTSVDAFIDLLKTGDLTVDMHDYGSFEKVGPLGTSLPRNDEQITTQPGDVILYQGDQITIYYDVNSWNFTRLGKIQDLSAAELKEILGSGNATVTFSLSEAEREPE